MVAGQAVLKLTEQTVKFVGPGIVKAAESLLKKLIPAAGSELIQSSKTAVTTIANNGKGAVFHAKQALEKLVHSVEGVATPEEHGLLKQIFEKIRGGTKLTANEGRDLKGILREISTREELPITTIPQVQTVASETPATLSFEEAVKKETDKRVQEALARTGVQNEVEPEDGMGKIMKGVVGIISGEVANLNSEVGWLIKGYRKMKGLGPLDQDAIHGFLNRFVDDNFRGKLMDYIKLTVKKETIPESLFQGLDDGNQTAIKWIGKLIGVAAHVPPSFFDAVAFIGAGLDWTAEFLHHIPILGQILKIPLMRKLFTGFAAFSGRFSRDIKRIADGSKLIKDQVNGTVAKVAEATVSAIETPATIPIPQHTSAPVAVRKAG